RALAWALCFWIVGKGKNGSGEICANSLSGGARHNIRDDNVLKRAGWKLRVCRRTDSGKRRPYVVGPDADFQKIIGTDKVLSLLRSAPYHSAAPLVNIRRPSNSATTA